MRRTLLAACMLSLSVGACAPDPSLGTSGRLHFEYQSGNAFSTTYPWRAMLAGTHEIIETAETEELPLLAASVGDATIVAITSDDSSQACCTNGSTEGCPALTGTADSCHARSGTVFTYNEYQVIALAPGSTMLTLTAPDGSVYDSIAVSVEAAATLTVTAISDGSTITDATALSVPVGGSYELQALAFDATHTQLEARFGIVATSANPAVTQVAEEGLFWMSEVSPSVESFDVEANALQRGTTTVTFSAVNAMQPVTVTIR